MAKIQIRVYRAAPALVTTEINSEKINHIMQGGRRSLTLTPSEQVALVMCEAARGIKVTENMFESEENSEVIINLVDTTTAPGLDCEIQNELINAVLGKKEPESKLDGTGKVVLAMSRAAFQYLESQRKTNEAAAN